MPEEGITCCSSWNDNAYEFVLENQAGQGLKLEDSEDRKALVMGLALHQQGKQQLDKVWRTLNKDMCMHSFSSRAERLCRTCFHKCVEHLLLPLHHYMCAQLAIIDFI